MMRLFTRQICSDCQRLKAEGIPDGVVVIDCDGHEGLGDAAMEEVYEYPTLLMEDGSRFAGYGAIKEAFDETVI